MSQWPKPGAGTTHKNTTSVQHAREEELSIQDHGIPIVNAITDTLEKMLLNHCPWLQRLDIVIVNEKQALF